MVSAAPSPLYLWKETRYALYKKLDEPQSRFRWFQRTSLPPDFEPRVVHLISIHYTDYFITVAHDTYTTSKTKIKYRLILYTAQFFFMLDYVTVVKFLALFLWFVVLCLLDILHSLVRTLFLHIHLLIVDTSKEDTKWSNNPFFFFCTNVVTKGALTSPFSSSISFARNKITHIYCWNSIIVLKVLTELQDVMTTLVLNYLINHCRFINALSRPVSCHE